MEDMWLSGMRKQTSDLENTSLLVDRRGVLAGDLAPEEVEIRLAPTHALR